MKIAGNILDLIGATPIVRLKQFESDASAELYLKLEYFNPGGSVKDRIALSMLEQAELRGELKPGATIVEPTSGNTGIGLAMVGAVKKYRIILTMPETMSLERRKLLAAYGAELILTPGALGMPGAIARAEEIAKENPEYFMPRQFENRDNVKIHKETTALEILKQMNSKLDCFVAGVGTGGTITGVGQVLRQELPDIYITAVEPLASPVLSGGSPGGHKIQGIGAGFVPAILDTQIYDEVIQIADEEAMQVARHMATEAGILAGISTGAAVAAAMRMASKLGTGKRVLAISPSSGERYLSSALYEGVV